ncbi:hypothetical protein AsAng_0049040 [Aureispira anguillae]|uniref:Antitoxin component YwqK of the YwqJK toxin-antitoxin module n=2 Tax=Aureispira anguillae TaxID=2864201 RepID=A0A915YJ29_9BACT|nr:hypothetical protein AsAng_0049040 [Aureispira anguillae]
MNFFKQTDYLNAVIMRRIFLLYLFFLKGLIFINPMDLWAQSNPSKTVKKIQSEVCWNYPIQNNLPTKEGYRSIKTEFNSLGKKIKMTAYQAEGSVAYEYFFEYKERSRESYWLMPTGEKIKSEIENYNQDGAILSRIRFNTDGSLLDKQTFDYEKGRKVKEVYWDNKGQKIYGIEYSYQEGQNAIREIYTNYLTQEQTIGAIELGGHALPTSYREYKSSGPIVRSIIYKRDEQGRILSKKTYSPNNHLEEKEIYEYKEGETICSVYIDGGKKMVEQVVYRYTYHK